MALKAAILIYIILYAMVVSVQAQSIKKRIVLHDGFENGKLVRNHTVIHYYASSKRLIAGYVTIDRVEEYANSDRFSEFATFIRRDTILHFHGIIDKGKKNGTFLYLPQDNLFYVYAYQNDRQAGEFTGYYFNGQVYCRGTYSHGKQTGEYRQYYANGKPSLYRSFAEGVIDLQYQAYYFQNGQLESEGSVYNGKKVNEWFYYNYQGDLLRTEYYKKGRLMRTK